MRRLSAERGQTMIQLALLAVLLIGCAALAIDLGNGYLQRRRMQNAADAAALAGARELCLAQPANVANNKAEDYLRRNGVAAAKITADSVQITGGRVDVRADSTSNTILAGTFGFTTLDVGAEASAVCGRSTSACGLWPIAFEIEKFQNLTCGKRMIVWNSDNDDLNAVCTIDGHSAPVCDCYDCDDDNDGTDDFDVITELSRGWLDFSDVTDPLYVDTCNSNGCGASELVCRIRNDSGSKITLPACIPGIHGVKAGAKDDVNSRAGQIVAIPLFSSVNCPSGSHCSGSSADSFYVEKFGCIVVEGWVQNFQLNPQSWYTGKKVKSKVIFVQKSCSGSCMSSCGGTDGVLPEPWELRSVGLVQ